MGAILPGPIKIYISFTEVSYHHALLLSSIGLIAGLYIPQLKFVSVSETRFPPITSSLVHSVLLLPKPRLLYQSF